MWASILKRNVSYIINHFLSKLVRSRCLVNNNNVARCCVEMLRACGWAIGKKGLSDRDRSGAFDRKHLSLQMQVTSG